MFIKYYEFKTTKAQSNNNISGCLSSICRIQNLQISKIKSTKKYVLFKIKLNSNKI